MREGKVRGRKVGSLMREGRREKRRKEGRKSKRRESGKV